MYYAVKSRGTDKEYFYRTKKPLNIGTEYEIECGEKALYDNYGQIIFSNYCPHCGAIMGDEVIEND